MVSPIPVAEEPPRTAFVFIDLVPSLKIQSGWNFWGERCFSYTGLFIEEGGWDPCVVACSAGLCSAPAPPPHPRLLTQNCLQCSCLPQQGKVGPPRGCEAQEWAPSWPVSAGRVSYRW